MGFKYVEDGESVWNGSVSICVADLKYHESWDWLMPVVEKIENMEVNNVFYEVLIADRCCSISIGKESEHFWVSTGIFECSSKIDAVWQTVVKFIKQTDYV